MAFSSEGNSPHPRQVYAHLEDLLASPVFAHSHHSGALLRFITERAAAGHADQIQEFRIAVEIYDRPPDFNAARDSIVRDEIGRLRHKLADYYRLHGANSKLRIELAEGSLVPKFCCHKLPLPPTRTSLRWLPAAGLLAVLLAIATAVLTVGLPAPLGSSPSLAPTRNSAAMDFYLEARYLVSRRTRNDILRAIELYRRAIERDPGFAQAYSAMAQAYVILAGDRQDAYAENIELGRRAAKKALELNNNLAEAHITLTSLRFEVDHDWYALEQGYRTALAADPSSVTGHLWFGINLMAVGRFEDAELELRHALALQPQSLHIRSDLVMLYYFSRRYERARLEAAALSSLAPDAPNVLLVQAQVDDALGNFAGAREKLARLTGHDQKVIVLTQLGCTLARQGDRAGALRCLNQLSETANTQLVSPYHLALILAALGRKPEALTQIEESIRLRDAPIAFLKVDPRWDPLRQEERFHSALRQLGLWDSPILSLNRRPAF